MAQDNEQGLEKLSSRKTTRREFLDVMAKATLSTAAFCIVVATAGCGGGGSDSPNPTNTYNTYNP